MCGIAGIVAPDAGAYQGPLQCMVRVLRHRGPDETRMQVFDGCALGHTRLSIIDLVGGHQPMSTPDGSCALVFNGEIYGYQKIRGTLADYPFRTTSDTEVILALYVRYGLDLLAHLPGMFAFALWDAPRRRLLCARDRFGEKPLYYAVLPHGRLLFGSEIKALLASSLVDRAVDPAALAHYLHFLCVPPDVSIYRNIRALPPGCRLTWENGRVQVERYWQPPPIRPAVRVHEAAEELVRLARVAVQQQLVAEVEVAAFLSGGLDSSTIVALAAQAGARLKTFSFAFPDLIDERPYARQVAQQYGCDHHEMVDDVDIADALVQMARIYDEPFADSSNIATYLLSRLTAQHVKVVLSGDGADELFGGYDYWYAALEERRRRREAGGWRELVRRLSGRDGADYLALHTRMRDYFPGALLAEMGLRSDATAGMPWTQSSTLAPQLPPATSLESVLHADLCDYMPADILVKTDRAAMANSLEMRAPFLDVAFAEYAASLPWSLKVRDHVYKLVFREAFGSLWPEALRTRSKQGFGAPVPDWLQRPSVRALWNDLVVSPASPLGAYFDLQKLHRALARLHAYQHWSLLVLAVWEQQRRAA